MRGAARAPLPKEANPMSDVTLRAQVLAEALPYIQKYYGTDRRPSRTGRWPARPGG